MSPEQVRGEIVDSRSDVFSFGVLLHEMLVGELPFKGDHSAAIIYSITNEDPKPPSSYGRGVPTELDAVVARALDKNPDSRYQTIEEMMDDIGRYRAGLAVASRSGAKKLARLLLPTSIVFLAVAAMIFFNPFKVEIKPDQEAVAADHSLAIMYFKNVVNPEDSKRLGEIVTNLLITDLSESEYLDVVSEQRLYDILKLQGKEGEKVIDRNTATDVASHAGAKWMLLGSILQEEPNLVVTSRLVDVKTGKVAASQRITGGEDEKIFEIVDQLTSEIKKDLALPAAAAREKDVPVAEATTHSTEAYRYYLEGMDYLNKYYGQEAKESFNRALEYDSTFAMAYLRLSSNLISTSAADRQHAISKAVEYSDRASKKELRYINSASALISGDLKGAIAELETLIEEHPDEKGAYKELGEIYRVYISDPDAAIPYYRKAIAIDPMDKGSYNSLAYLYQSAGDIDNHIWAIYQYMSLAPDEANPHDSRGDLYAFGGKTGKAIKSYEKALELKPDFHGSRAKLGHMHLFNQDYDKAREAYAKMVVEGDASVRAWGRSLTTLIPMYQGRLDEAITMLEEGIVADRAEGFGGKAHAAKYAMKAEAYAARKDYARAIADLQNGLEITLETNPDETVGWLAALVRMYAAAGDYHQAENTLQELEKVIETTDPWRERVYFVAQGVLEREKGDAAAACKTLEASGVTGPEFYFEYELARAYLDAGRLQEAAERYEAMIRRYSEDRAQRPIPAVKLYYYLGLTYESSGRTGKAIEQYTTFLDLWQNADTTIPEVQDARSRLAQLDRS
jgi:tetratricopeptide (TPR) repeat protein